MVGKAGAVVSRNPLCFPLNFSRNLKLLYETKSINFGRRYEHTLEDRLHRRCAHQQDAVSTRRLGAPSASGFGLVFGVWVSFLRKEVILEVGHTKKKKIESTHHK